MATQKILKVYKDYSINLKISLDNQYRKWQDQINSRNLNMRGILQCHRLRSCFDNDIEFHQDRLEADSTDLEVDKQEFKLLIEELEKFKVEFNVNFENFTEYVVRRTEELEQLAERRFSTNDKNQQGLSARRIQQFELFQADESLIGFKCVICMGNIEVDRNMMRLDCDGQHTFCQVCIEGWFATKKTCSICRHVF